MTGLGEFLRAEREKRMITIEQVASATKINVRLLYALETENFDSLPAKPFVRGFVNSYCRYLGLDPIEVLKQFDTTISEKTGTKFKRPADAPHIFVDKESPVENQKTVLSIVMASFIVVAVVVFVVIKPSLKHRKRMKEKLMVANEEMVTVPLPPETSGVDSPIIPPKAASTEKHIASEKKHEDAPKENVVSTAVQTPVPIPTPTPSPKPTPKPSPTPTPSPTPVKITPAVSAPPVTVSKPELESLDIPAGAPAALPSTPKPEASPAPTSDSAKPAPIPDAEVKQRMTVRATEDSWVKYQSDDRPLQGYILKAGKTIYVRARAHIRFMTGNPKGLEVSINGKSFQKYPTDKRLIYVPDEGESFYRDKAFN